MNVNTYPSLAVALWPAQDAALWLAAKEAGDPLEKPGVASQWSPATVRMTESGYGSFLSWQLVRGQLDTDRRPIDRISQETVRAFIKDYEVGRAELTVAAAVRGVAYVFRATHPPHGIPWLTKLAHYMSNTAKPSKSKVDRMASVPELLDLADKLMKAGRSKFEDGRRSGGQTYRDGLMIAMLANRPLRVRNFAALKIGQALTWDAKNFHVVFSGAGETKKGNIIEFDLPRALIAPMRWYLDEARPILRERAKLPDDDLLWVGRRGTSMDGHEIFQRITTVTKRHLGRSVNPHLFRDCVATTVAIHDSRHVGIVTHVLGHTHASSKKFYVQATSFHAARRHRAVIAQLRGDP